MEGMSGRTLADPDLTALLGSLRAIAVVGLSPQPDRPSHGVAAYLQRQGYRVRPVNPAVDTVLGERAYPDMDALEDAVDAVVVFRRSTAVPPIAAAAVRRGVRLLWLQEGITHPAAEEMAAKAGLRVVSNRCIMREHRRLLGGA